MLDFPLGPFPLPHWVPQNEVLQARRQSYVPGYYHTGSRVYDPVAKPLVLIQLKNHGTMINKKRYAYPDKTLCYSSKINWLHIDCIICTYGSKGYLNDIGELLFRVRLPNHNFAWQFERPDWANERNETWDSYLGFGREQSLAGIEAQWWPDPKQGKLLVEIARWIDPIYRPDYHCDITPAPYEYCKCCGQLLLNQ